MAHRVGKRRLFAPEDAFRQEMIGFKGAAQEIFALLLFVALQLRVDGHDIGDKRQVAEGDARFQ